MKKIGLALAACLLLAACGSTPPPTPPASSRPLQQSLPPGVGGVPSSAPQASSLPGGLAEALAQYVNTVLDRYATGAYPTDIVYHTEGMGQITNSPPESANLPRQVAAADIAFTTEFSEYYGTDGYTVTLPLDDDYEARFYIVADEDGTPKYLDGVYFIDLLGEQVLPQIGIGHNEFTDVVTDRVRATAFFEGFETRSAREPLSGSITWYKANRFVWLYFSLENTSYMFTADILPDGSLQQEYPTDEFRPYNPSPYSDEVLQAIAADLLESLQNALAAEDLAD